MPIQVRLDAAVIFYPIIVYWIERIKSFNFIQKQHYPANSQYMDLGYPCPAKNKQKHHYPSFEPPLMDT